MRVTLVTGGARSGKSRFAQQRATALGGDDVTFIATGVASDAEMSARIEQHRAERPAAWRTIEAPLGAGAALRNAGTDVVLLDCLTLLVANALLAHPTDAASPSPRPAEDEVDALLAAAAQRDGELIIVTNEVGWSVVPDNALARCFRDAAGLAGQHVARTAAEVFLLVLGIPVRIAP
jgi:adenosylcobinamide kinase / adenosylcobinamide-phosphate guanylyltransferase